MAGRVHPSNAGLHKNFPLSLPPEKKASVEAAAVTQLVAAAAAAFQNLEKRRWRTDTCPRRPRAAELPNEMKYDRGAASSTHR